MAGLDEVQWGKVGKVAQGDVLVDDVVHGGHGVDSPVAHYRVGNEDPNDDTGLPTPHHFGTTAALMLRTDLPPHEVRQYLGMSMKLVLEHYGHHYSNHQQRGAAA